MKYSILIIFMLIVYSCSDTAKNSPKRIIAAEAITGMPIDMDMPSLVHQNFKYKIFSFSQLPNSITPNLSLTKIFAINKKTNHKVRELFLNNVKKSLVPTVGLTLNSIAAPGTNLLEEIFNFGTRFSVEIRKKLKKLKIKQKLRVQLMVAPTLSDELVVRNSTGEVPLKRFYSKDKYSIYNPLKSYRDAYLSAREVVVTDVYKGIGKVTDYYSHVPQKPPFFITLTYDIEVHPEVEKSKISLQAIVGMPTNQKIPFSESNEEITFKSIILPPVANSTSLMFSPDQFPCAHIQINYPLDETIAPKMHVNFGPLGTYKDGKWIRPPGVKYSKTVPKLRGVTKKIIEVDFHVYNLMANIKTFVVEDLDLYLSFGPSKFSKVKFGLLNKTEVDDKFKDEINKNIQDEIKKQKQSLISKVEASDIPINAKVVENLLQKIFVVPGGDL